MTTPSGKPPNGDERAVDSDWESLGAPTPRRDSSPTGKARGDAAQRAARAPAGTEELSVYGVAVPYGGDDRTEEIEPIALDMPFEERSKAGPSVPFRAGTPRLPPQAPPSSQRREPAPRARERELKAPVAQLVLSDLFDSTPPPPGSSLSPPDPAAFSSRPPPAGRVQRAPSGRPATQEPRAVPRDAPSSPWTLSRKGADAKYFDSVPRGNTPAPAEPRPPAPSFGRAGAATPVRGGPGLRSSPPGQGQPSAAPPGSVPPAGAAPQSRQPSIPATRSISISDRPNSGGVVALPSINVLAEGAVREVRKPLEKRASEPPAALPAVVPAALSAELPVPEPAREAPVETPVVSSVGVSGVHDGPAALSSEPKPSPAALAQPERDVAKPLEASVAKPLEASVAKPLATSAAEPLATSAAEPLEASAAELDASMPGAPPPHDDDVEPVTGRAAPPLAESAEAAAMAAADAEANAAEAPASAAFVEASAAVPAAVAPAVAPAEPESELTLGAAEVEPSAPLEAPPSDLLEVPEPEPTRQRRSVPTLESYGTSRARPPAGARATSPEKWAAVAEREAAQAASAARFPSDVPTSRPPDVLLGSDAPPSLELRPAERPSRPAGALRPARRPSSPPQLAVAVPPSTKTGQISLPSVMLGEDVEAEPNSAALRRAQRAARQTVRIELPEGFGRPGGPLLPGMGGAATFAEPAPSAEPGVGFAGMPRKKLLTWAAVAVFLLGALVLLLARPRSGSLVVTALGPGHRAVDSVQIFVDERPLCATSPCLISGLKPGAHQLQASAPGLASQGAQTVEITAGEEAAVNIELSAVEADILAGGFRIGSGDPALTLFVDERRVGKLPQTVSGLASGKHWIKLDREDGSAPIEKAVLIRPGEIVDVDPTAAKRDKALVTIRLSPDSEGASVTLDDAFLLDFPAEIEVDPKTEHVLTATKPGYEDFSLTLQLDGAAEKVIDVALTPLDGASARRARPAAATRPAQVRKVAPAAAKPASGGPALDPSQGLLNVSSVPPSQIILNGRPLGSTPKTAIVVPGDSLQTIVFVHPKMGRRRAQKFVPAGKERTVSIRF